MKNKINRIIIYKNKIKELEIKLAIFFVKYNVASNNMDHLISLLNFIIKFDY